MQAIHTTAQQTRAVEQKRWRLLHLRPTRPMVWGYLFGVSETFHFSLRRNVDPSSLTLSHSRLLPLILASQSFANGAPSAGVAHPCNKYFDLLLKFRGKQRLPTITSDAHTHLPRQSYTTVFTLCTKGGSFLERASERRVGNDKSSRVRKSDSYDPAHGFLWFCFPSPACSLSGIRRNDYSVGFVCCFCSSLVGLIDLQSIGVDEELH